MLTLATGASNDIIIILLLFALVLFFFYIISYKFLRFFLFLFDPEKIHKISIILKINIYTTLYKYHIYMNINIL